MSLNVCSPGRDTAIAGAQLEEVGLVERARHEADAFAELYRRHREQVYAFALSRLRDEHDAEDVVAEVFVRALAALPRYRQRGVPVVHWLLRIAHNVIADQHRQRRPLEELDEHRELAAAGSVEDLVVERERARRVLLASRGLPAGQRAVLALRFGQDLTHAQIGRVTGRGEAASKIGLHRALRTMRAALAGDAGAVELAW